MKIIWVILLLLSMSVKAQDDIWTTNDSGYAVRQAENTLDFVGVNICTNSLVFATPTEQEDRSVTGNIQVIMRVDTETSWEATLVYKIAEGMAVAGVPMKSGFVKELVKGKYLRVKWADTVYSRFDLDGLTKILSSIKCDSDFFPKQDQDKDADYFL